MVLRGPYFASKEENRMKGDGDSTFSREHFLKFRPNNLQFLLQKRFQWMKNFISKDDIVTGSRYLDKSISTRTKDRLFLSLVFNNILIRGLLGSKLKDNNCGFRAIKKNIGINLFSKIKNTRDFGMVELIILAQRMGYTIKEFPVKWHENPRRITLQNILRFLLPALDLWVRLTFKRKN